MPKESAEQGWTPGAYHSTLSATRRYLENRDVDFSRVTLVKGWFKDTLTPDKRRDLGLHKTSLIMIDCDIYSSSAQALSFCEPLIRDQAVVFFDDWGSLGKQEIAGQRQAFSEFLKRRPWFSAEPMPGYSPRAQVFLVSRDAVLARERMGIYSKACEMLA